MAVKVFNSKQTFLLENGEGKQMVLPPLGFADVPEEFTGCQTFKMGVAGGAIQIFTETKQGDKIEKTVREPAKKGKAAKGDAD